jgi:hypothetical protein
MATDPFVAKKASRRNENTDIGFFDRLKLNNLITSVRVKSIVLDDTHEKFKDLGEWSALGAIEFELISDPSSNLNLIAYPLNPNIKSFPLINEIVYTISLPSTALNENNTEKKMYYINNVGIWNHPHHNAFPSDPNNLTEIQRDDYVFKGQDTDTIEDDITVRQTNGSTGIYLGKTFEERDNIHPLLPFEGDFIQEGRWGNSLRFGSTVKNKNNWSNYGQNGDPITIFRNGQGNQTKEGWIPIVEDVNNDKSSIYLTSTQNVPLTGSSTDYTSYPSGSAPLGPNQYNGAQILLNSGRLVFNSTNDHILLSSPLSINLNALESINIDTPKNFIVQSKNMYLGSNKAKEPLMLGEKTITWLSTLITSLENLNDQIIAATTSPTVPGAPSPLPIINAAAGTHKITLTKLKNELNNKVLTSESNFTV